MAEFGESLMKNLAPEDFERFRDWIHHHSGIYLEETKVDSLRISLVTRATRLGFVHYDEYFKLLSSDEVEFKELMNLVTINETSFFRFPAQFEAFRDKVIPEILDSKPKISRSFRVWSAGCSTGEEPYSIGVSMLDSGLDGLGYRPEVLGTDVSTQALDKAKAAVYPAKALAGLPQNVVQRWFETVKGGQRPVQRVRDTVNFSYHNLVKEPYPLVLLNNWDVIFCRNVTIYFKFASTRRVVDNFFESLNPGGYLFIGHSETLTSISDRFEAVEVGGVFLYRKPRPRRLFSFDEVVANRDGRPARVKTADLNAGSVAGRILEDRRARREAAESDASPSKRKTPPRARPLAEPAATPPSIGLARGSELAGDAAGAAPLIAEARALLERGEPAKAKAFADQALALDVRNVDAMLVRAHAHADASDFASAIADASRALAVNPLLAPACYMLGVIYQRQGDLVRALDEYKRTIYIDQHFVLAHFNVANIQRRRGESEDACRAYENTMRSLYVAPEGAWTAFLGGFKPDLLAQICERSLIECRKGR